MVDIVVYQALKMTACDGPDARFDYS